MTPDEHKSNQAYYTHLEAPAAEVAGEWLEPGVLPAVGDEVGGLAERLPAHHALVRLLT